MATNHDHGGGDLGLTIPLAINAGVGVKANNLSTDQDGKRGSLTVPARSAIMIDSKLSEDMGANTLWNSDGLIHFQGTFSTPAGGGNAGLSLFGAQGHETFVAIESHNTGLLQELAMFDNSNRTNAVQAIGLGLGKGPSSDLVAFYGGYGLKVSAGLRALGYNSTTPTACSTPTSAVATFIVSPTPPRRWPAGSSRSVPSASVAPPPVRRPCYLIIPTRPSVRPPGSTT